MKTRATFRYRAMIVLLCFGIGGGAHAAGAVQDLLERIKEHLPRKELQTGPKSMTLDGGIRAETAVFRETTWQLKTVPQIASLSFIRAEAEAMKLPDPERLKQMNRYDDYSQLWFVSLAQRPRPAAGLRQALRPESLPHRYHRELAFLGEAEGYACYGYMPIFEWIFLQRRLTLLGGDDALEAAARGLSVDDPGAIGATANSCAALLVEAGAKALPYLRPLVLTMNNRRAFDVLGRIQSQGASELLLECCRSTNKTVTATARWALIAYPRPEAEDFYFRWFEEDAGHVPILHLLEACAKVNKRQLSSVLPRVLASPREVHEFRRAFELSRELSGKPIPPLLLNAEETIRRRGYRSGPGYDQEEVDKAIGVLIKAEDAEAAGHIGLSLACAVGKGDWGPANQAGQAILRQLPERFGRSLAKTLIDSCADDVVQARLKSLIAE